ncbi:MAG: MupG family TIM beta-alpha barrel fold protein [Bacillota bacterium]
MLGISVYAGLDLSLEENINYLLEAKELGVKDVFLSLHIPEVNNNFLDEMKKLILKINELEFNLTADISKKYYEKLDIEDFKFDALRFDFGFNNQEIAELSQNKDFKINLNASTLKESDLKAIIAHGGDLNNLEASHNYYPRKETGLSEELLSAKNKLLKKYNLEIGAFVPAEYKKRPPMKAGLPTLEKHRELTPLVAAQDLLRLGVDKIFIGDSRASEEELKDFAAVNREIAVIPINISRGLSSEEKRLLKLKHKNRQDPGEYIIRSETARQNKMEKIKAHNNIKRFKYAVTIDNCFYQRYEGDLQILKKEYPADKKINVVADAGIAAVIIEKINEGEKFKFIIKGER